MELAQLESLAAQYEKAQPDLMRKIEPQLRQQRKILTETFLNASDADTEIWFKGDMGKAFFLIRRAGLHHLKRTADEDMLLNTVFQKWQMLKIPSGGILLGIMLMCPPYLLPVPASFSQILPWLRTMYARYLLTPPALFHQIGEADRYADFLTAVITLFHNSLLSGEAFPEASEIADIFLKESDFIQIYFNDKNLSRIFRLRAEIAESLALSQKMPLSHVFPPCRMEQKLKIGILASALNSQPETLLLLSYLDCLPKEYCTVTVYTLMKTDHRLEEYCRSRADRVIHLPEGDDDTPKVKLIRQDALDVMLIGGNITAVFNPLTRLAMFRLAKIQAVVENSPLTSGFTHSDYYISSEFADPDPAAQEYYSEKLYRSPGTMGYYAYSSDSVDTSSGMSRTALHLPQDAVVYCSAAKIFKVLPEVSSAWAKILSRVPNSYLMLMPFHPNIAQLYPIRPFINRIHTQMAEAGVDFSRIRFIKAMPTRADLRGMMTACDIYLDSFPYTGACSLTDPLHIGLPTVTVSGKTLRSNVAAAILRTIGIEEMITGNSEEYIEKAVLLGQNPAYRNQIRRNITQILSRYNPITDTTASGIKLFAALKDMSDRLRREEIRLTVQQPMILKEKIQQISAALIEHKNPYMQTFAGNEVIRLLILPYFASSENKECHVIDIGSCSGSSAKLFLDAGWHTDMFEPDPACEAGLNQLVQQYPGKARMFRQIVSHEAENMLIFYQAQPGFSSLDPSPYSKLQQVLFVRSVHLRDAMREHTIAQPDMIHIDAEGSDLQIFSGYEMQNLPPKCVMLHFDAKFPMQSIPRLESAVSGIKQFGYESLILTCRDTASAPNREYRLTNLAFDLIPKEPDSKGTIIFFRREDSLFLATLLRVLQGFLRITDRTP